MAEAYIKSFDSNLQVFSAGTKAEAKINPITVKVMKELGFDLSKNTPTSVDEFVNDDFDYVITVCDGAKEICPIFTGNVKHRLHISFEDPAEVTGEDSFVLSEYRRIRDEIKRDFLDFYQKTLKK